MTELSSIVALVVLSADGMVRYHTDEAARMMRGPGVRLVGQPLSAVFGAEDALSVREYVGVLAHAVSERSVFLEARCVLSDGEERWLGLSGVNLLGDPDVEGIVLNLSDRTEYRRNVDLATTDPLTGIGNRRAIERRLDRAEGAVVILADLDNFKGANDTFGHQIGDEVVVAVARRLQNVFGPIAMVGRVGGDEFAIVLPESAADRAWRLAEEALVAIGAPIGQHKFHVTASMGIAHAKVGEDAHAVMRRVDEAMYLAKQTGRARICAARGEELEWEQRRAANPSALEAALRREAQLKSELARQGDHQRRDDRTGLLNAEAYEADIAGIDVLARQAGNGYALALCDIDYFKLYNTQYGYTQANHILRSVADALQSACRPEDLVYRWGGEELIVVLRDTDLRDAAALAERLRAAVQALEIAHENRPEPHTVTISVGVAALDTERHADAQDLFDEAERHLKDAKDAGRNRVSHA